MPNIPFLLNLAKEAALLAGEAILKIYSCGNFQTLTKNDGSPITLADKAAQTIIVSCLQNTGFPILSEEGADIPYSERREWEYFWMVDPLDGTKEFIKRTGQFTVNVALIQGHRPVTGVIYAPTTDILYYGSSETGVYKKEKGKQRQLPFVSQKISFDEFNQKATVTLVASVSHLNEPTKTFINQFENRRLTNLGSSLKLMLVAEGSADIYPRLSPTMEWDTAAGDALLRAVNKGVYNTDLQTPLSYNKEILVNPPFVAF